MKVWVVMAAVAIAAGCGGGGTAGTTGPGQPAATSAGAASDDPTVASLKSCFEAQGFDTSGKPNNVVKTSGGNFEVAFPKGTVVFLVAKDEEEAGRAVKSEVALAKLFGVDASDLVDQKGNVVFFWDGVFRHSEEAIERCLP